VQCSLLEKFPWNANVVGMSHDHWPHTNFTRFQKNNLCYFWPRSPKVKVFVFLGFSAKDTNGESFCFSLSFLAKDTNSEVFVFLGHFWPRLPTVKALFFLCHFWPRMPMVKVLIGLGHFWPRLPMVKVFDFLAFSAKDTNG